MGGGVSRRELALIKTDLMALEVKEQLSLFQVS